MGNYISKIWGSTASTMVTVVNKRGHIVFVSCARPEDPSPCKVALAPTDFVDIAGATPGSLTVVAQETGAELDEAGFVRTGDTITIT